MIKMYYNLTQENDVSFYFQKFDKYLVCFLDMDFKEFFSLYWNESKIFRQFYFELQKICVVNTSDNFVKELNDKILKYKILVKRLPTKKISKEFFWYLYTNFLKEKQYFCFSYPEKIMFIEYFNEMFIYLFQFGILDFYLIYEKYEKNLSFDEIDFNKSKGMYKIFIDYLPSFLDFLIDNSLKRKKEVKVYEGGN